MRRMMFVTCLLLLVLVSPPKPYQPLPRTEAATFTVTSLADSGPGSLRQTIIDANGAGGADVINFSVAGTINLASGLLISDDVTINGSGITLDGSSSIQIMTVGSPGTVIINDLSFQNGSAAVSGGAINNVVGSTLEINSSTFSGNSATSGGAIVNSGTATITNSTFSGNSATGGGGGGAIWNPGTLAITNSTFSGNSAGGGGAIWNPGTLAITNNMFSGNMADNGGAIDNANSVMLAITNSTFSGNSADFGFGGAIYNFNSTMTVTNSTFSGNSATSSGGTLYHSVGTINVASNLMVDGDCSGAFTDGGNNLSFNATGCPSPGADPQLGPLQNNRGPTDTMLPAVTGPAVDAYPAPCATTTDQRGIARPQGSQCDIGATEQAGPLVVALDASAACNGPNLDVTISAGDGPFNITASAGVNTPVNGVSVGITTINGPEKWDDLSVTETDGDFESISLGQFRCRSAERPVPITPLHQSHTTNAFPVFSWSPISIANNYRVFVFDDKVVANRTVDIRQNSGGPTSMQLSLPLPNGRLFWRVRGRQNRLWSLWSVRFTLFKDPAPVTVITPVPTIDLNPPSDGGSVPDPAPTFPPPPNFTLGNTKPRLLQAGFLPNCLFTSILDDKSHRFLS